MRPMRAALLWASTSPYLARHLPQRGFARRAVTRFMPGETLEPALKAAAALAAAGLPAIITQLGENVADAAAVRAVRDQYLHVIGRIAATGLDCHLSVKPTHLGLDLDRSLCLEMLGDLAATAAAHDNLLWLDMESSAYTDATLALYRDLRARWSNVGICLQANLRRTPADLARLLPLSPAIRLVKGAYAEPADRAYQRKREVDASYLALAQTLLREHAAGGNWVIGLGTHDLALVRAIAGSARALDVPQEAFELQMLYGIRPRMQRELLAEGFRVRVLISYGTYWFPWYMRRLAERPANVWFVARSLFAR